jgi:PAS domain-containing protein
MILRIVFGRLLDDNDAMTLAEVRERITTSARSVRGLESLVIAAQLGSSGSTSERPLAAAIVSVWRDVELMLASTAVDEVGRFLGGRLALPFEIERADHYEILGRTFAALPPESLAIVRVLRVRARRNDEARLVSTLRAQQPRLVELGLVAGLLGRRFIEGGEVEAVMVSVWPDRATLLAITRGRLDAPIFSEELAEWADRTELDMYDGIEVAPHLPARSGPPLLVLDEELRIVDLTAAAAAMLGRPATELVGMPADALFRDHNGALADGALEGEASWDVPDIGSVLVRYLARRDTPIDGRHTVVVHRRHDPPPTADDLDRALAEAFPGA